MGTVAVIQAIVTIVSFAYQQEQHKKMKKKMDAAAEARKGQKFTISGTSAPLPIVYGKQRLGGIHCSYKVKSSYPSVNENANEVLSTEFGSGAQSGSKNEFLGVQTALCHGGIESVKHILVNEIDYRGYTKEMKENKSSFNHRFLIHKDGGTADASATAFGFPNTNRFTGCAYVNNFFKLNRDEPQYSGIPSMGYIVKGRKVRAITRSGSSPNYSYSLSSSYTYSNNPALCLLDYLLNNDFGRGLTANDVDLESFYNAADICDTPVLTGATIGGEVNDVKPIFSYTSQSDFPTTDIEPYMAGYLYYDETNNKLYTQTQSGSAPNITANYTLTTAPATDTIPLYECNITLSTEETIRNNIERILNTMGLSDLVWTPQGKYKLILSYPQTQSQQNALITHTFDEDSIVRESVKIVFPKAQDRFNQVTVSFDNEFENFKDDTFTWPPTNSAVHQSYLTEDNNQPLTTSLQGDGVTSKYHAQALAEQQVRKSRHLYTLNFTVNKEGLTVEPGDLIKVSMPTMSITNELYRVESIKVNNDFSVEISAYKFDFSVLAWNVPNDLDYVVKPTFDFKVEAPTSLSFTNTSDIAGTASGKLSWTAADDASVVEYIIEAKKGSGSFKTLGTSVTTDFDIIGLKTGTYTFSVRSKNITGLKSERVELSNQNLSLITVGKVAVIYANSANEATNTQTYTFSTGNNFVAYYEYDSDLPTLPIRTGINFTSFIGPTGPDGASSNIIFKRSATAPTTPSASSGVPSGWYDNASSATGTDLLWASSGTKGVGVTNFTWTTPFRIEGEAVTEVAVYRLNSNSGLTGGSYNFVTNTLTPPTNWSINAPSLANNGDIVYRASGIASGSALETSASVSFGSAAVHAKRTDGSPGSPGSPGNPGEDGEDGEDGADGTIVTLNGSVIFIDTNPVNNNAADFKKATIHNSYTNLTEAFLEVNPLTNMNQIPDTSYIWNKFVHSSNQNNFSYRVWQPSSQTWTNHATQFDSPIFSETVISQESVTQHQTALTITADQLTINQNIEYGDGGGWKIGKTSYTDTTDGLWIGNPAGSSDFALATGSNAGTTSEHGIRFDINETKLINPKITKGSRTLQSTVALGAGSHSVSISANTVELDIEGVGGGGGGDGAQGAGSPTNGNSTTWQLRRTSNNALIASGSGAGGAAGSGVGSDKFRGDAGEASAFASGGAGGGSGGNGGAGSLGSGGGGGGGRAPNWDTSSKKGGAGGSAGTHFTDVIDLSNRNYTCTLTVTVGSGGNGSGAVSYGDGGAGGAGVFYYTRETDALETVFMNTERAHSIVTTSRTWNTWYLNGSNEAVISVFVYPNTYRVFTFHTNTSASTTGSTVIGQTEPTFYKGGDLTVIVPPGHYYSLRRVNTNSGDQINFWGEYK